MAAFERNRWSASAEWAAGVEKDKAALLVVVAAQRDGRKVVLAVEAGHRESTPIWQLSCAGCAGAGCAGAGCGL